jgi:serine/threonine protein kinase
MGLRLATNLFSCAATSCARDESSSSGDDDCYNSSHFTGSSSNLSESIGLNNDSSVAELTWDDIKVRFLLGKGSYSKVKSVTLGSSAASRTGLVRSKKKYAIKYLRNTTIEQQDLFTEAAVDLAMEAQLLAFLNHDNIVSLYGQGCLSDAYANSCKHFLLIDRLDNTLDEVMKLWRFEGSSYYVPQQDCPTQVERIQNVALPITRAMEYLHSEHVVYRDLKPHNVGMTADGTIKLFDFGLARIKHPDRKMTGRVGSPLYMSPEVSTCQDYGLPADVYSFAILLWELMTTEIPFPGITRKRLEQAVILDNRRPIVDKACGSQQMQELISNSWIQEPHLRPTFSRIRQILENEVTTHKIMTVGHKKSATVTSAKSIATSSPLAHAA